MDVAEWQKRLEKNFSVDGYTGGHLFEIIKLENEYGKLYTSTFHGQLVLIDSFQSFYVETIRTIYKLIATNGWPKECPYYTPILLYYVMNFRSFRACENLLLKGYPLDGYSLLRNLKDRAVFLGGIANNITTFNKIYGYAGSKALTDEVWKKWKNEIKKEEQQVLSRMLRKDSGLPEGIVFELTKWEQLFHSEVHGSKLSFFGELGEWIKSKQPPSLGPLPNINSLGMYMNRAVEIGWMLVKLLPYLQPTENAFGDEWKGRHKILDESFRFAEQGLSEMGKKIADAFIFFVDKKLQFVENFHYFEADGTA